MAKTASGSANTSQREIVSLKRRLQAIEKAVWPTAKPTPPSVSPKRHLVEVDEKTARRMAIDQFDKEEDREWLRQNPDILDKRRAKREKLNAFLRARGLDPEPEIDG